MIFFAIACMADISLGNEDMGVRRALGDIKMISHPLFLLYLRICRAYRFTALVEFMSDMQIGEEK